MRVMKLTHEEATIAEAFVIENPKSKQLYFNIWHGMRATNFWSYVCGLDHKLFAPECKNETLKLENNNFVLKPVIKKGTFVKDNKGNVLYCLTTDNDPKHRKDILLFWEIPNYNFFNVKYTVTMKAGILGEGSAGKVRGENVLLSPYPVIEILGDCTLSWMADDIEGNRYFQNIIVTVNDANPFKIQDIERIDKHDLIS